ncbi:hypothetical protein PhCBS80983_g01418 [Powellomyces hirtus]|uniref:FAD dependent oxidoreductase domain-containing protein n=1 Tax=Powellomyces hirtus TaxID=109895 RepID=A0A507ECJ3_9FUNG|nr:hypothetical protein PhCBS80983_g01418 [Powellomyces hirtus]
MARGKRSSVTVLGAGVVGLTTDHLFFPSLAQGYNVTIISRAFPTNPDADPTYTSPTAGAHWRSFAEKDDYRLQEWDEVTFKALIQLCTVPGTGLMITPGYEFWAQEPESWEDPFFARFMPKYKRLEKDALPATCEFGISYETGFGARTLAGVADTHVYPTRGQTVHVRAPHVRHTVTKLGSVHEDFTYIIPRDDGIVVLGGTYQANNDSLTPDPTTAASIVERCLAICPELVPNGKQLDVVNQKVGLRPTRVGGVRCDAEWKHHRGRRVLLVHNYGHGGYGYQSSYGCAATVLRIMEAELGHLRESPRERTEAQSARL